jgi:parallel beta-helix repeat protein
VTKNNYGIRLDSSSNNVLSGNKVANNHYGIWYAPFEPSLHNCFYHNNFLDNTVQVYPSPDPDLTPNIWHDGYPSGGNYWSDYEGFDLCKGAYQNETGSDGIGDTPYFIGADNQDNYPLMNPYPSHDVAISGVKAAPTIVCQGYGCLIEVNVASKGDYAETFNVTVYANMTDSGNVTIIRTFENVTLNSRDSTMLSFMWDTTGFDLGNYVISVYATPVAGEINIVDNTLAGNAIQIVAGMTGGGGGGKMPYMN